MGGGGGGGAYVVMVLILSNLFQSGNECGCMLQLHSTYESIERVIQAGYMRLWIGCLVFNILPINVKYYMTKSL